MVNFQKDISDLLLNYKLGSSKWDDSVAIVARAKTLTALDRLDQNRKGKLIQFLYEAKLIGGLVDPYQSTPRYAAVIRLFDADLRGIDLSNADLAGADLSWTRMQGADLRGADLEGTDLSYANLQNADLYEASLVWVDFESTRLRGANVTKDQLALAHTFKYTELPDGSTYPSQSYSIPNH